MGSEGKQRTGGNDGKRKAESDPIEPLSSQEEDAAQDAGGPRPEKKAASPAKEAASPKKTAHDDVDRWCERDGCLKRCERDGTSIRDGCHDCVRLLAVRVRGQEMRHCHQCLLFLPTSDFVGEPGHVCTQHAA